MADQFKLKKKKKCHHREVDERIWECGMEAPSEQTYIVGVWCLNKGAHRPGEVGAGGGVLHEREREREGGGGGLSGEERVCQSAMNLGLGCCGGGGGGGCRRGPCRGVHFGLGWCLLR